MITKNIIAGLQILLPYYKDQEGYHNVLYAYPTHKKVSEADVEKLIALGWRQEEVDTGDDEFGVKHYDKSEGWCAYV